MWLLGSTRKPIKTVRHPWSLSCSQELISLPEPAWMAHSNPFLLLFLCTLSVTAFQGLFLSQLYTNCWCVWLVITLVHWRTQDILKGLESQWISSIFKLSEFWSLKNIGVFLVLFLFGIWLGFFFIFSVVQQQVSPTCQHCATRLSEPEKVGSMDSNNLSSVGL